MLVIPTLLGACVSDAPKPAKWDARERVDVHVQLGFNYIRRNQLEIAAKELNLALALEPDHPQANHAMAILQWRLQNNTEAEKHFRVATRRGGGSPEAHLDYGRFLCQRDRVDEGMAQFKVVLADASFPRPDIVNMNAGECLMRKSDYDGAEGYLRSALAVNPALPSALFNMATISYETGAYLSARGYLERYFEVGRDTPSVLLLAVKTERQLGAADLVAAYSSRLRTQFAGSKEAEQLEALVTQ